MATQFTGKVVEVDTSRILEGLVFFRLQHMNIAWLLRVEDHERVEVGDVVTIEIPSDVVGRPGFEKDITEEDRTKYRLVRISKGGNPAFQG